MTSRPPQYGAESNWLTGATGARSVDELDIYIRDPFRPASIHNLTGKHLGGSKILNTTSHTTALLAQLPEKTWIRCYSGTDDVFLTLNYWKGCLDKSGPFLYVFRVAASSSCVQSRGRIFGVYSKTPTYRVFDETATWYYYSEDNFLFR